MTAPAAFFRVEQGEPDLLELAALAAVLYDRANDGAPDADDLVKAVAPWRRPERASGYQNPRTWQENPR